MFKCRSKNLTFVEHGYSRSRVGLANVMIAVPHFTSNIIHLAANVSPIPDSPITSGNHKFSHHFLTSPTFHLRFRQQVLLTGIRNTSIVQNSHITRKKTAAEILAMSLRKAAAISKACIKSKFKAFKNRFKKAPDTEVAESKPQQARSPSFPNISDADDDLEQRYWGPVRDIGEGAICKMVKRLIGDKYGDRCWVLERLEGSYNCVYVVKFWSEEKIVVKVPATGWSERWTPNHAECLRAEALSLRYIRRTCNTPVPDLLGYDTTFDNEIHAPFIMMTFINGKTAYGLWCDDGPISPEEREEKREKFLRNLAAAMAPLSTLTFDKIGMPHFDDDECNNPKAVRNLIWAPERLQIVDVRQVWHEQPAFTSSEAYWNHLFPNGFRNTRASAKKWEIEGRKQIFKVAIDCLPESTFTDVYDGYETFGFTHADFDLQNILVDDDYNITGIIDWDMVSIKPHYLAWASVPLFLRQDWDHQYDYPMGENFAFSPKESKHYRSIYVDGMREALDGKKGWQFTAISHMTNELRDASDVYVPQALNPGGYGHTRWVDNVVSLIMPLVEPQEVYYRVACEGLDKMIVADGETTFEDWMGRELCELFHNNDLLQSMDAVPSEEETNEGDNVTVYENHENEDLPSSSNLASQDEIKSTVAEPTESLPTINQEIDQTPTDGASPAKRRTSSPSSRSSTASRISKLKAQMARISLKKILLAALSGNSADVQIIMY